MKQDFEIKILELKWLDNLEESQDRCLHGKAFVKIGREVICDKEKGDWTLSSTALYLMRTVSEDYEIGNYGSQLIPCCGHSFMVASNDSEYVIILGCPIGIDWTIRHIGNDKIKHITESGEECIIEKKEYAQKVLNFANEVEQFYKVSKPKEIYREEFEQKGYEAFWIEWKKLKTEIENEK